MDIRIFFLLYLLLISLFIFIKRNSISSKFYLIRIFFPTWRFFEGIQSKYLIFYKFQEQEDWVLINENFDFEWFQLIHNPKVNDHYVKKSLIEHFMNDLQELQMKKKQFFDVEVEKLVSYQLILQMVKSELKTGIQKKQNSQYVTQFSFKIVALDDKGLFLNRNSKQSELEKQILLNDFSSLEVKKYALEKGIYQELVFFDSIPVEFES